MINKPICIVALVFMIGCKNSDNKTETTNQLVDRKNEITKVEVNFVEMDITTFARVKCSEFDNEFSNVKVIRTINNPEEVQRFYRLLKHTLHIKKKIKNIDVRAKGSFYHKNGTVEIVCFGRHGLEINGDKFAISAEFKDYLLKLTNTE